MYDIRRWSRLSHATFHLVTSLARELTVHSKSGLARREAYKALRTILEADALTFPLVWKSSIGMRWSSRQGVATFLRLDKGMPVSSQYLSTAPSTAPSIRYSQHAIGCSIELCRLAVVCTEGAGGEALSFFALDLDRGRDGVAICAIRASKAALECLGASPSFPWGVASMIFDSSPLI